MRSCRRTQCQPFSGHSAFEANWKGESWISGCLMSWPQIKKIVVWKCHLLFLYPTTMNHFMIRLWRATKNGFDDNRWWPAQWLDWEEALKHFQKQSWSMFSGLWPILSTPAFWILVKPLHLRSMLSKLMRCMENLTAGTGEQKGPVLLRDNAWLHAAQSALQKLNRLGYKALPRLPSSPDLLPTEYRFFEHLNNFLQGKWLHDQQEAGNAFQEFAKSQRTDFYATGTSKHLLLVKISSL